MEILPIACMVVFCGMQSPIEGIQIESQLVENGIVQEEEAVELTTSDIDDDPEEGKYEEVKAPEDEMFERMQELETISDLKERYLRYKEIREEYDEHIGREPTIYDCYELSEIQYMFRAVETEVFGGDFESKSHVANVILNRMGKLGYGDTIKEVVTMPNQFAYSRMDISDETILACEYAFQMGDNTDGAMHFRSGGMTDTFVGKPYKFTDSAGHHFY